MRPSRSFDVSGALHRLVARWTFGTFKPAIYAFDSVRLGGVRRPAGVVCQGTNSDPACDWAANRVAMGRWCCLKSMRFREVRRADARFDLDRENMLERVMEGVLTCVLRCGCSIQKLLAVQRRANQRREMRPALQLSFSVYIIMLVVLVLAVVAFPVDLFQVLSRFLHFRFLHLQYLYFSLFLIPIFSVPVSRFFYFCSFI